MSKLSMSEIYAQRDNIRTELGGARGHDNEIIYCIPCDTVGCTSIIKSCVYKGDKVYTCPLCKNKIKRQRTIERKEIIDMLQPKKEKAFNNATLRIEKQVKNFREYDTAIKLAKSRAERYDSIPEAMVAIELVRLGYAIIPQQKIGRYKVDFLMRNEKLVIEVDGILYHKKVFGGDREAIIQLSLGLDWKIIHIPAEYIAKNIRKLKKIIDTVLARREN